MFGFVNKSQNSPPRWLCHFPFTPATCGSSCFSRFSLAFDVVPVLGFGHSNRFVSSLYHSRTFPLPCCWLGWDVKVRWWSVQGRVEGSESRTPKFSSHELAATSSVCSQLRAAATHLPHTEVPGTVPRELTFLSLLLWLLVPGIYISLLLLQFFSVFVLVEGEKISQLFWRKPEFDVSRYFIWSL